MVATLEDKRVDAQVQMHRQERMLKRQDMVDDLSDIEFMPHTFYENTYISLKPVTVIDGEAYHIVIEDIDSNTMSIELAGVLNNIGVYNYTEISKNGNIQKTINNFKLRMKKQMFNLDEYSRIIKPTLMQAHIIMIKILGADNIRMRFRNEEKIAYMYKNCYKLIITRTKKVKQLDIYDMLNVKIKTIRLNKDFADNLQEFKREIDF